MTARKKPATARKAAKPVMAWGLVGPNVDGERVLFPIASREKLRAMPGVTRVVRVRIVEVRR